MKYFLVILFLALSWAGVVTLLTNVYLGGNFFLGIPIALVGGLTIGTGIAFWLRRRFRKVKTDWTD